MLGELLRILIFAVEITTVAIQSLNETIRVLDFTIRGINFVTTGCRAVAKFLGLVATVSAVLIIYAGSSRLTIGTSENSTHCLEEWVGFLLSAVRNVNSMILILEKVLESLVITRRLLLSGILLFEKVLRLLTGFRDLLTIVLQLLGID